MKYTLPGILQALIGTHGARRGNRCCFCLGRICLALLSLEPFSSQAQFTYTTNADQTLAITGYTGLGGPVSIPASISGMPVVSIGDWTFYGHSNLTSITIPAGIMAIGGAAFYDCTRLGGLTLPESLASIGTAAFEGCSSLTNVTLPRSLTNLASQAFASCTSLSSITLPNGVTVIQEQAFANCTSLTNLAMGNRLTTIEDWAFDYCTSLPKITIPGSVTSIGNYAFFDCTNLTSVCFQGNAPSAGSHVFDYDDNAVIYYLPGATNWEATFAGLPALLWNPAIRVAGTNFNVRTIPFGLTVTGTANIPVVLEACSNLANPNWLSLQSCSLTNGFLNLSDSQWTNYRARFYRVRLP